MKNYIIMSAHNRLRLTKKTLEQVFDFAGVDFVLWVVSDGSSDGTKEYFENLEPWGFCTGVEFTHFDEPEGKAKRLNAFLKNKNYDYCSVIDNDVLLPVDWLKKSIRVLQQYEAEVGMCCVNVEGLVGKIAVKDIGAREFLVVSELGGACTTWGSYIRENITVFCEDYGRYGHEDNHLVRLLGKLNMEVVCLREFGIHLDDRFRDSERDSEWDKNYKKMKADCVAATASVRVENLRKMTRELGR